MDKVLFSTVDEDIVKYRIWDFGSSCERNWYPWENFHSPISTYDDEAQGRTSTAPFSPIRLKPKVELNTDCVILP